MKILYYLPVFCLMFGFSTLSCDLVEEKNSPSQEEIQSQVEGAIASTGEVQTILELLGIIPVYECGEPRSAFLGTLIDAITIELPCATIFITPLNDETDALTLLFNEEGCEVANHTLTGELQFTYTGGEDLMDLTLDAENVLVDGKPLQATAGYTTCGDETQIRASAAGTLQNNSEFFLDVEIAKRDGIPVFGGSTILLDGLGSIENGETLHIIRLFEVEYTLGDFLPQSGTITIEDESGNILEVIFELDSPFLGSVTVILDNGDKITIVIPSF